MDPLTLLALAALGGGVAWWLWKKAPSSLSAAGAAMADLAAKVCGKGPRGEYAFNPDIAQNLVRMLSAMTYSYPSQLDQSMVKIATNPSGAPIDPSQTALGWATRMNSNHSILAPLYMTQPANTQDKFLRAVDPGTESEYAGPGGMYAVLAYVGAFARSTFPGAPPNSVPGEVPLPTSDVAIINGELPPAVAGPVIDLLQNGQDPTGMISVASRLEQDNCPQSAAILRRRAAALSGGSAPAPQPVPNPLPPPPSPAPPSAPLPAVTAVPPNVFHVNNPAGARVYADRTDRSPLLTTLPNGTSLSLVAQTVDNVWGQIANPLTGWLQASDLVPDALPSGGNQGMTNLNGTPGTVVAPDGLKVRQGPGTNFPEVQPGFLLQNGSQVLLGDSQGGWVQILQPLQGWTCSTCPEAPGGPWIQ